MLRKSLVSTLWMMLILAVSEVGAVPVYLSPQHPIPTGHYRRSILEKNTDKVTVQLWLRVRSLKGIQGWVSARDVLPSEFFSQFAQIGKNPSLRARPKWDDLPMRNVFPGTRVQVLQHKNQWVKVKLLDDSRRFGWIEFHNLIPEEEDIGYLMLKKSLPLRAQANHRSKVITHVPINWRLIPTHLTKDWIQVRFVDRGGRVRTGYIQNQGVLSRLNFATDVYTQRGIIRGLDADLVKDTIYKIKTDSQFIVNNGQPSYIYTKASFSSSRVQPLKSYEPLIKLSEKRVRWGRSSIRRKGQFWWPIQWEEKQLENHEQKNKLILSSKQLFKRNLFDMATSPKIPRLSFVSAGGIYKTIDGQRWEKVDQFHNQNHPIAISTSGKIFVGPYQSSDHGSSFRPYIRWDRILSKLPQSLRHNAERLRIEKIEPKDAKGNQILIQLDLGTKSKEHFYTRNGGRSWQRLRNVQ